MIRKLFVVFIVSLFLFQNVFATTRNDIRLERPLKLKLQNTTKQPTYLLCFTEQGFVTWESSYYSSEKIPQLASYHRNKELEYFQLPGKMWASIWVMGGLLALGINHQIDHSDSDYKVGAKIISLSTIGLGTLLLSIASVFLPEYRNPVRNNNVDRFPQKYIAFPDEIPSELQDFIHSYESDSDPSR